jgi:AraC-like DNA-binding protein
MEQTSGFNKKMIAATLSWIKKNNGLFGDGSQNYLQLIYNSEKSTRVIHQNKVYVLNPRFCLVLKGKLIDLQETGIKEHHVVLFSFTSQRIDSEGLFDMSPLLKEILNYIVGQDVLRRDNKEHLAIYRVLFYQLMKSNSMTVTVPVPKEVRLLKLYHLLVKDKLLHASLNELAKQAGASPRTIERLIKSELDIKFTDWRKLIRIQMAILLLSQGQSVIDVAIEVGYKSASSFINAFKEQMGISPKQYSKK